MTQSPAQILVVDDELPIRTTIAEMLKRQSYDVSTAGTGEEALGLVYQRPFDLLLLDLKMPGANGFEGLAYLRGQYPDLPIVVVSASEDAAIIQQVLRLGALGFIPKSVPMKELVSALNTVIGGDNWVPEGISLHPESEDGPDFASKLASLTPQQYKVLVMLRDGSLNKQIAWELNVSEATIKAHITAIFRKLGVKNRTQAVIALQQMDIKDS